MKPRLGDSNWLAALSDLMLCSFYPRELLPFLLGLQIQIPLVIVQLQAQQGIVQNF